MVWPYFAIPQSNCLFSPLFQDIVNLMNEIIRPNQSQKKEKSCPLKILAKYQNSRKTEETNVLSNPVISVGPRVLPKKAVLPQTKLDKGKTEGEKCYA